MKTKRTVLCGIFAVILALAFTACKTDADPGTGGGVTHTHTPAAEWSFNATQHWYECTANDGAKIGAANHDGDPCNVCGYDSTATLVTFSGLTADGGADATTTTLTLTFSEAITDLAATDITLDGVAGVQRGALSGSGPTYTLAISGVTAGGTLTVTVAKTGYAISGSPKTVPIYYYNNVPADPKAGLYGTWVSTSGNAPPYTLTISADTIIWESSGVAASGGTVYIQYDDVVWTATANNNTANKTNYPNGYTFTGTRTSNSGNTATIGFVALSADGKTVYLGTNASTASNISGAGAIYTKMSPTITTTSLPYGILGTAYSQTLAATGSSITWTLASGALPAGLALSTSGVISGTPATDGQFTFTVNAANDVGSRTQTLTITVAIPLTENVWADGNIPTSGNRQQWFTFTATASNQYLHAAFGTLTDLYVQVYDNSGTTVGSETELYNTATRISRTLESGQTYYIRVRPYSSNYSGTYRIGFNTSTTVPNVQLPANAIPLTENQWADGNLPTSSDVQWFVFTATASNQYLHAAFGTLTDLYVQVYDSSGAEVGSRTNLSSSTTNTSRTLSSGQTYYIRVVPSTSSYSGNYQIAFNASTTAPFPPAIPIPLTENQWTYGNIPTGGQQWFVFTATASTQYIHASFSTLTDLYVQVYDSGGETVGSETRLYSTTTRTSLTLTPEQTYYIRVRPYNTSGTGSSGTYQIGFNTSTTAPNRFQLPSNAIPLTENVWADDNIPRYGSQWFVFTATASTQYIYFQNGTLTGGVYVRVYDSGGAAVGNETALSSSTSRSLTNGQTYYIRVRPYNSGGYGTYQIAFNTLFLSPSISPIQLTANQWKSGNIPTSSDRQWFVFTATASTQYIHFSPFGTLKDVYVQVYDSGGATVGSETRLYDYGSTTRTSLTLTVGQTYYIMVEPYGSGSGTYRIGFNTSTTAPN